MATVTTPQVSVTATLTGTTADTVSVAGNSEPYLTVINHDAATLLWFRVDGGGAVADGAGSIPVPPGFGSVTLRSFAPGTVSVVGSGNKYTVIARAIS